MLPNAGVDESVGSDNVRKDTSIEPTYYTGGSGHPTFFTGKAEKRYYGELMNQHRAKMYAENRRKMYYEEHEKCCTIL